ncbi:MAG: SynChlorMet cassette protein ScmC [Methanothrix sp.]|nr:SynChlorMet cassette protein ScmC [Methanothrix sp.]
MRLTLADGTRLRIVAGDDLSRPAVDLLGRAMQLGPAEGGERLIVAAVGAPGDHHPPGSPQVCILKPSDHGEVTGQAVELSLAIARDAQYRGGILVHGALAERDGFGVIMAAPGCTGKSTASRRLPLPWKSLSDDAALVVQDGTGRYFAQPWPTWSLFWEGSGGSWPTERAVPLRAIFFLAQATEEKVEPVNRTAVEAMLMQSVEQVSRSMTHRLSLAEARMVHSQQLANVSVLANAVPAFILQLSLTGKFWVEMDRALRALDGQEPLLPSPAPSVSIDSLFGDLLPIVLTGSSMNPFLLSGDLLEVAPVSRDLIRGDVIYFRSPVDGRMVVHRVVGLTATGIQTRGDNNPTDDPAPVPMEAILGRVIAAHRGQRRFAVPGGRAGMARAGMAKAGRHIRSALARHLGRAYRGLAETGLWYRLLPERLRPRIVAFGPSARQQYKLISGRKEIGHYDERGGRWRIQLPCRLIVDESQLERAAAQADEARAQARAQAEKRLRMRVSCV